MSNFRVGQKVVCVDADWHDEPRGCPAHPCPLREGAVYTIESIGHGPSHGLYLGNKGVMCVWLREVENPYPGNGFAVARFRPAVTRKTSIEVFQRILNNPRLPIREDA